MSEYSTYFSCISSGGYLGVFCTHAYAHNTKEGGDALPAVLKGADMAVYEVFRALGLAIEVRTVLDDKRPLEEEEENKDMCEDEDEEQREIRRPYRCIGNVGNLVVTEMGEDEDDFFLEISGQFSSDRLDVNWITNLPNEGRNVGLVHMTVSTFCISYMPVDATH